MSLCTLGGNKRILSYRCRGKKQGILTHLLCSVAAPTLWNMLILTTRLEDFIRRRVTPIKRKMRHPRVQIDNETDVFVKKVRLQKKETSGEKTNTIFTSEFTW